MKQFRKYSFNIYYLVTILLGSILAENSFVKYIYVCLYAIYIYAIHCARLQRLKKKSKIY